MNAKIIISNLGVSEKTAREILEHVETIKKLGYALVCEGGKAVDLVEENVDI